MIKKIAVMAGVIAFFLVFYFTGLDSYLTLAYLKASRDSLRLLYGENPIIFTAAYCGIYFMIVSLNIPGAVIMGLAGGAFFGFARGVIIVSFTSSAGATHGVLLIALYLPRHHDEAVPGGH